MSVKVLLNDKILKPYIMQKNLERNLIFENETYLEIKWEKNQKVIQINCILIPFWPFGNWLWLNTKLNVIRRYKLSV